MGRSSSLKTNEAVKVPEDGPILWVLQNEMFVEGAVGMEESLHLLSSAKRDDHESEISESSPSKTLWKVLLSSDKLQPQLRALQVYRSKLLQAKESANVMSDHQELFGTYRLLLEWCLSTDIPTPLRRALISNLEALDSVIEQEAFRIREQVIESLLKDEHQRQYWSDPLRSLFEMLNYEPTRIIIVNHSDDSDMPIKTLQLMAREVNAVQPVLDEESFVNQANTDKPQSVTSRTALTAIERSVCIASAFKLFMAPVLLSAIERILDLAPLVETLQVFLWSALTCRGMPADELNVIGVVYGQTLLFAWKCATFESDVSSSLIAGMAAAKMTAIVTDNFLPQQHKLAAVQGMAATLPNEVLVSQSPPLFSDPLATYLLGQCRMATGSGVRLSALRALHTLINRCLAIISSGLLEDCDVSYINGLSDGTLNVVLQAWDSPPVRQVATAVPGLFRSLLMLLRSHDSTNGAPKWNLKRLVKRILDFPSSQKGKYLALEALLPEVGAKYMIDIANEGFIESLIIEIGKRGENAVAITDLLGELLSRLRVEMNEEAGIVDETETQPKKKISQDEHADRVTPTDQKLPFLPAWVAMWAPPLAHTLVSCSMSDRKNISSRSIPLLVTIVGGPTRRHDAAYAFCFLLDEVRAQHGRTCSVREQVASYATETETQSDRIRWVTFEIARQASLQKLLKSSHTSHHLASVISKGITDDVLTSSLTHSSQSVRLAAFAAIEAVVPILTPDVPPLQLLEKEVSYWRLGLPYAIKCGGNEFNKELLLFLSSLINRLSDVESSSESEGLSESKVERVVMLQILSSFVCDFLISKVIVQQGAYPGTVADKEEFVISLFQSILNFVSQDGAGSRSTQARVKTGSRCRQSPRAIEVTTMQHILLELLSDEPMTALFSLLHSMWDSTRAKAFSVLSRLVEEAHARNFHFPSRFSSSESVQYIRARAIYLASSPRQREADTGSKMLAFLCALLKTTEERHRHNDYILALLSDRLDILGNILGVMSCSSREHTEAPSGALLGDGTKMPMAHGLMMAVRLTIEGSSTHLGKNDDFYERFVVMCCNALHFSLSVVADLKEGATLHEEDKDSPDQALSSFSATDTQINSASTPLNVNTGAIGANAGFSSIQGVGQDETLRRFAFQRIIMGSWLMTKEACASLASSITCKEFDPSSQLVDKVGSLLIRTLTTLKHQGAAFAAHRALQEISEFCFTTLLDESFVKLPITWANSLVNDISGEDNVRDSTLRRSTGYALGFLSVMRSEPPSGVTPRTLCPHLLGTLVWLSLPPKHSLDKYMEQMGLNSDSEAAFYFRSINGSPHSQALLQVKSSDQWRTRVHSLNILRLAILDAPLACDTRPFISDAFMSSLIGYEDPSWAVRNSATMVFAAAMLRVVDADKNASSSSGNAITAPELFRRYPMLQRFLLQVMEKGVEDMRLKNEMSTSRLTYPCLYPILLFFSRLQPVTISGEVAADFTEPFIPAVLECLKHRQHKIRLVAARALSNISSNDSCRQSFVEILLCSCEQMLSLLNSRQQPCWNTAHGALLGIQHLLSKIPGPGIILSRREELLLKLFRFIESDVDSLSCPPPCASVALEILRNAVVSKSENVLDLEREFARMCITIVTDSKGKSRNSAGESRLRAIASRGFCQCCLEVVWDPAVDCSIRESVLESLSLLLGNDILDVRLEAAKAFKKSICSKIDWLVGKSDVTKDQQTGVVFDIAHTLQKALTVELNRNDITAPDDSYNIGMHPPTVRRISRCLLECCHALQALDFMFEVDITSVEVLSARNLWATSLRMLGSDRESAGYTVLALDTDRLLNGNAAELMAFALQAWISAGDTSINAKQCFFVDVLTLLNDEQAPWRLRHSVAIAIKTSQVLLSNTSKDIVLASKQKLVGELLDLLHDSDTDVRFVAGRALMQAGSMGKSAFEPASSQLAIQRGYSLVSDWFSAKEIKAIHLQSILESCRGAIDTFDHLEFEMAQSEKESPLQLMNLGTERKIFEDEVANSFEEVLLANQLRVGAVVKTSTLAHSECAEEQELLEICRDVLKRILARELANQSSQRAADIVHEVTWSNRIFPIIHSLLIGSTAAIYLGAEDSNDVRGEARRILSLFGVERETAMQPSVLQALEVLASARLGEKRTQDALLQCCFLVPSSSSFEKLM